jgi:hypothetical protein
MRAARAVLALTTLPLAFSFTTAAAREALDPGAACRVLQKTIAKRDGVPEGGPPGGWFCDTVPSKEPTLYVIALRASKPLPGTSNLIGWFAVGRTSSTVYDWDVDTQRAKPMKGGTAK